MLPSCTFAVSHRHAAGIRGTNGVPFVFKAFIPKAFPSWYLVAFVFKGFYHSQFTRHGKILHFLSPIFPMELSNEKSRLFI